MEKMNIGVYPKHSLVHYKIHEDKQEKVYKVLFSDYNLAILETSSNQVIEVDVWDCNGIRFTRSWLNKFGLVEGQTIGVSKNGKE